MNCPPHVEGDSFLRPERSDGAKKQGEPKGRAKQGENVGAGYNGGSNVSGSIHPAPHTMPRRRDPRTPLRRHLRTYGTPAEGALWRSLQRTQLGGRRFRRQHSIGPYIVDFYCPAERLAVELDGAGHFTPEGRVYDEARTDWLAGRGVRVVRFENRQVFEQPEAVLAAIAAHFGPS